MTVEISINGETGKSEPQRKKPVLIVGILILAISVAAAYGYYYFNTFISTDNASVEGHIVFISSKVPGRVKTVHVIDNQMIGEGDLLVEIDPADYLIRLEKIQKGHQTDVSLIKKAESEYKSAIDMLNVAEKNSMVYDSEIAEAAAERDIIIARLKQAQDDMNRHSELYRDGFISRTQLDDADTRRITLEKEVESTGSRISARKARRDSQEALIQNLRIQTEVAKNNLDTSILRSDEGLSEIREAEISTADTKIIAPSSGIIGRKNVEKGQYVTPGQPLLAIVSDEAPWIIANYKETQLADIKTGMKVLIQTDMYPDLNLEGTVESIAPASGAKFSLLPPENATGNFTKVVQRIPVRIKIIGENTLGLKPGMSVKTTIDTR